MPPLPTTTLNGIIWDRDARYFFYKHGPLARLEYGQDIVQGSDYLYSLQGWIKGVNIPGGRDPGHDAETGGTELNRFVAKDEYGYGLGYFVGDYTPINVDNTIAGLGIQDQARWGEFGSDILDGTFAGPTTKKGLFNGNIAWMGTDISHSSMDSRVRGIRAQVYQYDQLNRIKKARSYHDVNSNSTVGFSGGDDGYYDEQFWYDQNGNLDSLKRYAFGPVRGAPYNCGGTRSAMDNFKYLLYVISLPSIIGKID